MVNIDNNNNNYKTDFETVSKNWKSSLKKGAILSILFAGVGGQGIILATTILAQAAIKSGFDVKVSEVHGMAQRGGSVEGSVRIGKKVFSPIVEKADFMVALEKLEGLRYINRLNSQGVAIINDYEIYPLTINGKNVHYPDNIESILKKYINNFILIEAVKIAKELNELRTANTILLGVLSKFIPFTKEHWEHAIIESVPKKAIDLNIEAFNKGRNIF